MNVIAFAIFNSFVKIFEVYLSPSFINNLARTAGAAKITVKQNKVTLHAMALHSLNC
jgi:hypothetical protein